MSIPAKPTFAVYKFTSCDGCQLALLNAGELLLQLADLVEIVHFAEAGPIQIGKRLDIVLIEGSITTEDEIKRLKSIREHSNYIIAIGACATVGGIQALRQMANHQDWMASVYARPEYVQSLDKSLALSQVVHVDDELYGCPVNTYQVMQAIRSLLYGTVPRQQDESVCMECKRKNNTCVLVTKQQPCMGPVTHAGCGAICPSIGRACYGCYGPKERPNTHSFGNKMLEIGLTNAEVARTFLHINSQAEAFNETGRYYLQDTIDKDNTNDNG